MIAFLPLAYAMLFYVGTTVIAALGYALLPNGLQYLAAIRVSMNPDVIAVIGTPLYYAQLLLPLGIVPATAVVTIKLLPKRNAFDLGQINLAVLAVMMAAVYGYCAMRLHQLDALNLDIFSCGEFEQKTAQRLTLLDRLGFPYMYASYGANIILPILAYLGMIYSDRKKLAFALFIISLIGMLIFVVATMSKAPVLVFVLMFAAALAHAKWTGKITGLRSAALHVAAVSTVCAAVFFIVGGLVYEPKACAPTPTAATVTSPHLAEATPAPVPTIPAKPIVSERNEQQQQFEFLRRLVGLGIVQRIGAGFPFYLQMYGADEAKCGVQGTTARKVLMLPPPRCTMGAEVFPRMWIGTKGNQPASAFTSAYAEIGTLWSVIVMFIAGLSLGLLGWVLRSTSGPLAAAVCAAACGFAFYVSQVPILASFTYNHGLFIFLVPVAVLWTANQWQLRLKIGSQ